MGLLERLEGQHHAGVRDVAVHLAHADVGQLEQAVRLALEDERNDGLHTRRRMLARAVGDAGRELAVVHEAVLTVGAERVLLEAALVEADDVVEPFGVRDAYSNLLRMVGGRLGLGVWKGEVPLLFYAAG